jgi:hypothetical protein
MNRFRSTVLLLMVLGACSAWAQSGAQKTLDRFKSMAGTWTGTSAKGQSAVVTYQLMAGGTSVLADIKMGDEAMTSMYYVDGDRLLMTHFCPSNNQPRMKAAISADGKSVTFDFLDATNLASPEDGHMHRVVYVFVDPEHYSEDWTWKQAGKDAHFRFEMQRKK